MKIDNMIGFRILLLIWILVINLVLQLVHIEFGWVVFISNIMFFTMSGDIKNRLISVELGGTVGLILAFCTMSSIIKFVPSFGQIGSVMIPLAIVLFVIIVLNPISPAFFNNTCFAYFTCALINTESFMHNFTEIILVYLVGSVVVNIGCIALIKKQKI